MDNSGFYYEFIELDNERTLKHNFKWIESKDLKSVDFRPAMLKEKLSKFDFKLEHIIYKEGG